MKRLRVVLCTSSEREALRLAHTLVSEKLAACVNIVPSITSVYRWNDDVCEDKESLLIIKTTLEALPALTASIRETHSYSVPEAISLTIRRGEGNEDYLAWLEASVQQVPETE